MLRLGLRLPGRKGDERTLLRIHRGEKVHREATGLWAELRGVSRLERDIGTAGVTLVLIANSRWDRALPTKAVQLA